jgi:hypothetical protein
VTQISHWIWPVRDVDRSVDSDGQRLQPQFALSRGLTMAYLIAEELVPLA